jgi:hypothetical protein
MQATGRLYTHADLTNRSLNVTQWLAPVTDAAEWSGLARPSSRQHFVGEEYSTAFPPGRPIEGVPIRAILVGVKLTDGSRPDWLVPGLGGEVTLQFLAGRPAGAPVCLSDGALLRLRKAQ